MTPSEIGILGCLLLVLLLTTGKPVAFCMALVGLVGFALIRSPAGALSMTTATLYEKLSSYDLTVIPLFVLMGQVAFHSGISRRLFHTAYCWLGPMRGGLAMATVGACAAFGAICGSGPATSATMAAVALPEMKRYRYSMELATGAVASGGTLGMMIPPSVVFICYGVMTQQSIGRLFISGILPGIMTVGLFCITIYIQCVRRPELGPAAVGITWAQKFASITGVIETLALFALVMGGMFLGWFTPTEAAAVGAAGVIVLAVARRQLPLKLLVRSLLETIRTSCMVMVIVAGAIVFGKFLDAANLASGLATWLASLALPGWIVMSIIIFFYVVAGCFVDALAVVLLTVPIFYPVVMALGYDPVWFGVIIVLVTQIGVVTPPVGVCAYVVSGMERDVPLETVFKGCMPFIVAMIVATALVMIWPQIALVLPNLVH